MNGQAPQHPGRQQQGLVGPVANEQGLGQVSPSGAEFFTPSVAMDQFNAAKSGQAQMRDAQIAQASAAAGKAQAEQEILGDMAQQQQQGAVQSLAAGMLDGSLGNEQLAALVQNGEVSSDMANAAMQMANEYAMRNAQSTQQQGLGGL